MHPSSLTRGLIIAALLAVDAAVIFAAEGPPRPDDRPPPQGERDPNRPPRAERPAKEPAQKYTLEQAMSDRAQLHTIAFSGLAFLSGDFGASTFIPPGKVCDFFGFQYMRDIDAAQKGHNPMFLNRVAGNVLHVLTDEQEAIFTALADKQARQLEDLARRRLPIIKAFHLQASGEPPADHAGLSKEAVVAAVGDIFAFDAELSLERAQAMAAVAASLTPEQKQYLGAMKFGDFNTWPALDERDAMKNRGRGKGQLQNVAFMTYASEFFSWTAGSLDADVYFCPERHGTYFGGFYMKDMPAMGQRDFDISTSVTGDSGRDFLETVLTEEQRREIAAIPDQQRALLAEVAEVRRGISIELRKLLTGGTPNRERVVALGRRYGQLDGEMSWIYATAFARVNKTLSAEQRTALARLRNLDGYTSAPYYIYSRAAKDAPKLEGVERFFASATPPTGSAP